jgi:hypothetical protein
MKLIFPALFFLLMFSVMGQQDPNNDPNWNWLEETSWKLYHPDFPNGGYTQPLNPFYQPGIGAAVYDNRPEDGWVLLNRNFGRPNSQIALPYLILYNKYQGILRLFVYLRMSTDYTVGSIRLFADDSYELTVSLTFLEHISWGRNDFDKVKNRDAAIATPIIHGTWAFADFPITYDPIIVNKINSRLKFEIWGIQNYSIDISGLGNMNQVFGTNSPMGISNVGPFTIGGVVGAAGKHAFGVQESWLKWQNTIENIGAKIPENSSSTSLLNLKNWVNNVKSSWLIGNLGLIGAGVGFVDFLITGGRITNKEQPAPMNFLLNFSLTGTMKTQFRTGGLITLPLPGATHNVPYATDLLYNQPLGILNLQNTPVLQHRMYYGPEQRHSYRIKDELLFDFNPSSDLEVSKIEAAYVFEITHPQWAQRFLEYADQGYSPIDGSQIELESYNNEKYVFRTPYVNAFAFKYQKITLPAGFNLFVKIKAEFKVKNSSPDRQPVIFIATYDANIEEGDGVGAPWPTVLPFTVNISREFEFSSTENLTPLYGYIGMDNVTVSTPATIGNYVFTGWSDGSDELNRTFSSTANVHALYKYPHHSNYSSAFFNNGQRKCVRVLENNHILLVYESMGKIWLERSTDNGGTWSLLNGGKPISFGTAKHPSISQVGEHKFVIVYQKLNFGGSFNIVASYYNLYVDDIKDEKIVAERLDKEFSDEATVVIGNSRTGLTDFLIVWHEEFYGGLSPEGGLYYRLGRITTNPENPYGIIEFLTNGFIGSTSASSVNPSIACKDEQIYYPIKFHLVWQNNVSTSASTIRYREITYNGQQLTLGTEQVLSNGSGYTKNHNPSTTVMNDNIPRVTWRGERVNPGQSGREFEKTQNTSIQSKVLFTDPSVNYFWGFGSNVGKPNINRSTDNLKYIMAWSQNNSEIKRVDNTLDTNNIALLATLTGSEVQVVSGTNLNNMRAITLNNTGNLPYYFQTASVIPVPAKTESPAINGKGREGVVYNGDSQFFFLIGDVKVNGSEVDFVDVPASTVFSSDSVLNRYMQTETFTLDNSSEFLYSVQYGITDSAAVDNYLQNGNSISFAVELIDAATGALLGKFDEVTYNSQNIYQYDNLSYEVNTEGIGNREVYLRLATNNNGNVSRSLTIVGADASLIAKRHTKKVGFNGIAAVTDYALSQNYPNPFNPVTTINYQIPKDGFVSLKVYDILGKEIATLVNSDKAQGKYTVEFDGSRFASGMYIYKLQSGDFVETRKMMMLK